MQDQIELERYYFDTKLDIKTFCLCHYDNNKCPSHTFLIYKKNDKFFRFEHSWSEYKRIHEYNLLKELLIDIRKKFIETELNNKNLLLYEYKKPKYNISLIEFYKHFESNEIIDIDIILNKLVCYLYLLLIVYFAIR